MGDDSDLVTLATGAIAGIVVNNYLRRIPSSRLRIAAITAGTLVAAKEALLIAAAVRRFFNGLLINFFEIFL